MGEGTVDIPERTGTAELRELEFGGAAALENIARDIGFGKVKRDARQIRALQCAEAVGDLFETGAEAALQALDVVARGHGRCMESAVGHQQRAGEIIGERDAGEAARILG